MKTPFKVRKKDRFSKETIKRTCKLQYNKLDGKIYLYIPEDKPIKTSENRQEKCSIDPGLRRFTNVYDKKEFYSIDNKVLDKIKKIYEKIKNSKNIKRKTQRKKLNKVRNKITQMHWSIIKMLTNRYDKIYIGILGKSINKKGGNLAKSQKDLSSLLSHYKFRQRLKAKCDEKNVKYVEVNESYTSKTCGKCGKLKQNLGGNKTFECKSCGLKCNRDLNGARNIMIKAEKFYKI